MEKEKMLAGQLYDASDPELSQMAARAKELMARFNNLAQTDAAGKRAVLESLLGQAGENLTIAAPFYVDYGAFIRIGRNCEINMDCVFLDCNYITIGDNTLIGPGVHIYAVTHPLRHEERFPPERGPDMALALGLTKPVTVGKNVWIGGGSIILPGVTIGDNCVIGAGSVVTRSVPAHSLAQGNPARVTKKLG